MADQWYVYHGGDNDPGYGPTDRADPSLADNWTNAFTTIGAADTASANGDTVYVASDHVETTSIAHVTITGSSDRTLKTKFISVKQSDGSYETMVAGGGKISTTGTSYDILFYSSFFCDGLYFESGDDIHVASGTRAHQIFNNCKLVLADSFSGYNSSHNTSIEFYNCDISFTTGGSFTVRTLGFTMRGGSISSAAYMTSNRLFSAYYVEGINLELSDVDMSGVYSDTDLFSGEIDRSSFVVRRCKMWTGWGFGIPNAADVGTLKIHSCDTEDGYWHFIDITFYGSTVQDTAYTLNATYDGTNKFSAKMVSADVAVPYTEPLRFKLCEVYAAANSTFRVELTCADALNNDEFWIEIESNGATDEAFGDVVKTRPIDIMATPTALETSSEVWSTTDLIEQYVEKAISGGAAGRVTIWACLAKPATTVYVDPDVTVS